MIEVYRAEWGSETETLIGSVDSLDQMLRLVRVDMETAPNKKKLIYSFKSGAVQAVGWGTEHSIIVAFEKVLAAPPPSQSS